MQKFKNYYLLILSFLVTNIYSENLIWLENELLHRLDGIKGAVDGTSIYKMATLCKKTNKFQYGKIDKKSKERRPQHKFQSKLYTLKELVVLEEKISKLNNTPENKKTIQEFEVFLEKTKDKMMDILRPFLIDAKGSYDLLAELIKESCSKRNRSDSELLRWDPKNEEVSFKRRIKSFKSLDSFCTDLINFQKDVVYSAPKATALYEKWLHSQRNKLNDSSND